MTDFKEVMEWYQERAEESAEEFPGDMPEQGVGAVVTHAARLETVVAKAEAYRANEEVEDVEGLDEQLQEALENQCLDIIAAMGYLQRDYDLDIAGAFEDQYEYMEAVENAETEEELRAVLEEHDIEVLSMSDVGVQPGDDVTRDDYNPDDPDRGVQ